MSNSRITVTFEPDDTEIWEDIVQLQTTVKMKKGVQTHIQAPGYNNSHHDAVLQPTVTLRSLHQIQSISHLEPLKLIDQEKQKLVPQSITANTTQNHQDAFSVYKRGKSTDNYVQKIVRELDLQRLNEKEREQAFKLLREEADVF